jgi:acyl-CoA reductase-like NAD-dependent aldehyde dehydrogenase
MSAAPQVGSAAIPQAAGTLPASTTEQLDAAIADVAAQKDAWVAVSIAERVAILEGLIKTTLAASDAWVTEAVKAKGITPGTPQEGEEWLAGPMVLIRNLRLLAQSLRDIERVGHPRLPAKPQTLPSGQVVARVFPTDGFDKMLFSGFSGEIWMDPAVTEETLESTQGVIYQQKAAGETIPGKVALVLGAGNVASIGPMDALYKFFVEDQVVVLKMNPVNEYLGPIFADAFKSLIDANYLRIVYGGAKEGAYLCSHDDVDEIHITGSDKTHDAIVFGVGPEGQKNKAADTPTNTKRVTSELGNVSPVIVVPGPWTEKDLAFQGANLASMLTNNAGFNCNATRVIINHADWAQREALLDQVRATFKKAPPRKAYYPGADSRHAAFTAAHPNAEQLGGAEGEQLPWTLIPGLDPAKADDICFTTEAFCSVFGEVALEADDPVAFLEKAVEFANNTVWGTLNATLLVHPASLKDPRMKAAVDKAIADLRFGSVGVNHWPALAYGFVSTTWGAFPGHTRQDVQSGIGVVHNTYLFDRPQKTVIRGPFSVNPKPPWFCTHKTVHQLAPKITRFEAKPSAAKLPSIIWSAMRG